MSSGENMDVEVSEQHMKRLEIILRGMRWPDPQVQLCAVGSLLKLVETGNVPIETLMRPEILPTYLQFLEGGNPDLQLLTCKLFANVASESTEAATTLLRAGVAPVLAELLRSPKRSVATQSLWTLAILSEHGPDATNLVWKATVLPSIMKFSTEHVRNIMHDMETLIKCRYPTRPLNIVRACLPFLAQSLSSSKEADVVENACLLIAFLTRPSCVINSVDNVKRIQVFIEAGVARKLFDIISRDNVANQMVIVVLEIISHMTSGNDQQRHYILGLGCLDHVSRFMKRSRRKVLLCAYEVAVNICAGGNQDHIQMLMNSKIFTELLNTMKTPNCHLENPALALAYIACHGSEKQIKTIIKIMVSGDGVQMLISFFSLFGLSISLNKQKMVFRSRNEYNVVFRSLENLLEASAVTGQALPLIANIESAGGVDILRKLQQHTCQEISAAASHLLETLVSSKIKNSC